MSKQTDLVDISQDGIPVQPVFKPVAVTGATPSLNVGTYNFFDNGTLTANTTVSFASVPTNAKWSYNCTIGTIDAWDISTAVFQKGFSVSAEDSSPTGVFFKPDGLKMYILSNFVDEVNEYDLSTAWDVTSATFLQFFSVTAQDTNPAGIFFKPDGTKMYISGMTGDDINEYNLSTAWDISTAVYSQAFSVSSQDASPAGITFKPDGLKMYMAGNSSGKINEYDLSTAWDISTASFLQLFTVISGTRGIFFKSDGLTVYITATDYSGVVVPYSLSTAWDISTATQGTMLGVNAQDSYPSGVFFRPEGYEMYITGQIGADISEFDIGTPTSLTFPASVSGNIVAGASGEIVTYDFVTLDGGTTVSLTNGPANAPQSTAAGAVGTYALLTENTVFLADQGSTKAGSNLNYSSTGGAYYSQTSPSGTWRCMGYADSVAFGTRSTTVWVRIS